MEISVEAQALSLAGGLLLGMGMGLVYDLFRILRWNIPLKGLGAALDLAFWAGCTAALFLYAQWAERGEVRGYLALALLGGGWVYSGVFSPVVRGILWKLVGLINQILRIFRAPFRVILAFMKKFRKKRKNIFSSFRQWYKIKIACAKCTSEEAVFLNGMEGDKDVQDQAGRASDQAGCSLSSGLFDDSFAEPER